MAKAGAIRSLRWVATVALALHLPASASYEKSAERSALVLKAANLRVIHKQYAQALDMVVHASAVDRADRDYDEELVYGYLLTNQIDRCIAEADKRLLKNRDNFHLYRARAQAYLKRGENKKALADFNREIELRPLSPNLYRERAEVNKLLGQFQLAQNDLQLANNVARYQTLAFDEKSLHMTLLVKNGHFGEAERLLPKYLKGKPEKIFYLSDIAKGFARAGRTNAAINCCTRYLQIANGNDSKGHLQSIGAADQTAVRELLVSLYSSENKMGQAILVLDEGIRELESRAKGTPAEANGQTSRARINLSRLLTARAEIYMVQGNRESARGDLERSLSLFPDALHARELMKKLSNNTK